MALLKSVVVALSTFFISLEYYFDLQCITILFNAAIYWPLQCPLRAKSFVKQNSILNYSSWQLNSSGTKLWTLTCKWSEAKSASFEIFRDTKTGKVHIFVVDAFIFCCAASWAERLIRSLSVCKYVRMVDWLFVCGHFQNSKKFTIFQKFRNQNVFQTVLSHFFPNLYQAKSGGFQNRSKFYNIFKKCVSADSKQLTLYIYPDRWLSSSQLSCQPSNYLSNLAS